METLLQQQCVPVAEDEPALTDDAIRSHLSKIPDWELVEEDDVIHLRREFRFPDFFQALLFANKVGEKAETQNHHPRLMVEWGQATVEWWTHAVGGLHENDFVMAAKTDDIYSRWKLIDGYKDTVQQAAEESFPASDPPATVVAPYTDRSKKVRYMPYQNLKELPDSVRDNLPKHAQEIYLAAFNNAWDRYQDPDDRHGNASREETAHRVAWSAVKQEYEKVSETGDWQRKQD